MLFVFVLDLASGHRHSAQLEPPDILSKPIMERIRADRRSVSDVVIVIFRRLKASRGFQ